MSSNPETRWVENALSIYRLAAMDAKDPLDPLLDEWGTPPEQTPLTPEVWHRLAHVTAPARSRRARAPWWRTLDAAFGRVSFAVAFVVACTLLGLFLAEMRVSKIRGERDRQLAETYLRLIDPLLVDASRPLSHTGS